VNDPTALEGAMVAALDAELRTRMGRAGRARAERHFSRERIADAMVDLYLRENTAN
jgi:glycosyltransferase involved in cell wall biosynthesis